MHDFADIYGPWALVTGAAEGMGAAFVDAAITRGIRHVIAVDRDPGSLALAAARWRDRDGVDIVEVVTDLGAPDASATILDAVGSREVGLFVSNAAIAYVGEFADQPLASALDQLEANCRNPLVLVHALLAPQLARGHGGIVLLSSLSAMRGTPITATYAATKAWNLILAESLWEEVRERGVDVLAVLPGTTRTPGWESTNAQPSAGTAFVMEPAEVAAEAYDALGRVPSVICGEQNRQAQAGLAQADRADAVRLMGVVMRQMYPPNRAVPE